VNGPKQRLEQTARKYHEQLINNTNNLNGPMLGVISYLREHGIGEKDIAIRYRLGVVSYPLVGDERFQGSLSIPYLTTGGVRAIKFRKFRGDIKFDAPLGQAPRLYNTAAYFKADKVIGLTEGEIDAIVATERLGIPCMGIPGAEVWRNKRETWAPLLKDFETVFVFADGDDAGDNLSYAITESIGMRGRVIRSPDGEDVSSMVASGRGDELTRACQLAEGD
jgi:hypothetical protein